jgi:serine protease Do
VATPQAAAAVVAQARKAKRDSVLLLVQRGNTPPRYIGIDIKTD